MRYIIHVLSILICVVALVSGNDKTSSSNEVRNTEPNISESKAIPKAKADFESLSVEISGIWRWWQKARFKVMGDGLVEFSMNKSPNDAGRYESTFNLKQERLISLNKLLENTGWLTQPDANVEPGYTDASRIEMTISRQGIINEAWCHDRNPEPYGALVKFIEQIYRQEFLFNSLKSEDEQQRINASREIFNELIARMGLKSYTPSLMLAEVDFTRYEEVFIRWMRNPAGYQQEELCVAIAWVGYLNRLDCYDHVLELKDVYCRSDWDVVCETLLRLGGPRAVSALKDLARVRSHRLDHAVSALIRSGQSGIRELMLILEEGQLPAERPQMWGDEAKRIQDRWTVAERVVRACMDKWDLLEFTVESKKQVAAKVEKLLASRTPGQWDAQRTEYFEKYLEMANRLPEITIPDVQVEGDFHVTRQKFLRLLALPEPQLRHAREAIEHFKAEQDWPSLATAYEVSAETMWRITHTAPEEFTRPATEQATDVRQPGFHGPYVMVQINLDGEWFKGKGKRQNWIDDIQRKQKNLVLERIAVLKKLGALCMDRLDDPARAVLAYKAAGRGVPVCTEALETLIARIWPVLKAEKDEVLALDHVGAAHIRLEPLQRLAEAQVAAGNLCGAADTRLRAMLTALIGDRGDWNAHGSMQEAEAFWQVVRRLPLDQPLPPTLWLRVLDPGHAKITITAPEDGPHGYPISFPGPRLVIRPGHTAQTLTVSADMETPGGSGGVRCFTIIKGKVHDLGWVEWHKDNRRGREWRQATFDLPEDVGIIRLAITPFNDADFHVRNLKVEVDFTASGVLPSDTAAL